MSDAASIGRLRWRCRRGTRELDRLLEGWIDAHAAQADAATLQSFSALLETQDPVLWDWLAGRADPDDAQLLERVREIRSDPRV